MEKHKYTGKTKEEAISNATIDLQETQNNLIIKELEEIKGGLFKSKKIEIEDYTGKDYTVVKQKLEKYDIKVLTETKEVSETENIKENIILSQDVQAGTKLGEDDVITFTIPSIYKVYPNFVSEGYTLTSLQSFCHENGLVLNVTYEESSNPEGTVIYQSQKAGAKVVKGATLNAKIAKAETTKTEEKETSEE